MSVMGRERVLTQDLSVAVVAQRVAEPPVAPVGPFRRAGRRDRALPFLIVAVAAEATLTEVHQSTALTKTKFNEGLKAGPFHSVPPDTPGQKWVSAVVVSGVFTLVRVVKGVA